MPAFQSIRILMFSLAITTFMAMESPAMGLSAEPPEPVVLQGHTKAVTTVAWPADGKTLATAGDDRTIRIWELATGQFVKSVAIAIGGGEVHIRPVTK